MQDKAAEQKVKLKTLAYVFAAGIVFMLAASWYATQNVAELCGYSPLLGFNISHIYLPWQYFVWCYTPGIAASIPQILEGQERWFYIALLPLMPIGYVVQKSLTVNISHGSAAWATAKDIDDSGLGLYEKETVKYKWLGIIPRTKEVKTFKNSGVVIGVNPYTKRIMLDDDSTHVLLMAPTRSGKGINTIIPTGLIWQHSIFFFDVKKELWQATAAYRKKHFKQKVMKFDPLCADGSSARWNPLAEVDFQTDREINDVSTIVEIMVRPDGKEEGDKFWPDSAAALLKGVILHLLYSHYQEGKPLPCPTDIMSFLSSPDKNTEQLFTDMKNYPHISRDEFMSDHNVLYEIYGEYIRDWRVINKNLASWNHPPVHNIQEVKKAILDYRKSTGKDVDWRSPQWAMLLSHPKVAESAAVMLKGAEQTSASIMQTAQTALALYQNPVVQKNTAVSDFTVRDLLDPSQAVSMYLCMQMDDLATVKPLSRLFINTILSKLIRDMKFSKNQSAKGAGKQRLLLMLDEFPQLGNMNKVEQALAVCAGYGIKMCIVTQDINQLNKAYTKENSIASNCKLRVFFRPNDYESAKNISDTLGKYTISTVSHSDGGGLFKGSDSTSFTARELMTPDEVARLPWNKEIVFADGISILGNKLRYFEYPWFTKRILPEPLFSDTCTTISSYDDLFRVHEAERQEQEHRTAAVKEAKTQILLDSALNEKAQAEIAVREAEAEVNAIKKKYESQQPNKEARRELEAAESRLSIAKNVFGLALANADVYASQLRAIALEVEIANLQAEKNSSSAAEDFVSADSKLNEAKAEYEKAKKKMSEARDAAAQMQTIVDADNRMITAKMNYMAAADQFDARKKSAEAISQEADECQKQSDSEQGKENLSERKKSAQAMLDFAEATRHSAKEELAAAEDAYRSAVAAMQQKKAAENSPKDPERTTASAGETAEQKNKKADWRDGIQTKQGEENDTGKNFNKGWATEVYGFDPADEEIGDEDIEIPYFKEEGEDEDGTDDESAAGGGETQDIRTQNEDESNPDDEPETSVDESWSQGENAGEEITFPRRRRPDNVSSPMPEDDYDAQLQSLLIRRPKKNNSGDSSEGGGHAAVRRAGTDLNEPPKESRRRRGENHTRQNDEPRGGRR